MAQADAYVSHFYMGLRNSSCWLSHGFASTQTGGDTGTGLAQLENKGRRCSVVAGIVRQRVEWLGDTEYLNVYRVGGLNCLWSCAASSACTSSFAERLCGVWWGVWPHPIHHTPLQYFSFWGHFHLPLLWSLSKLRHSCCSGRYRGDRAGSTQPCSRLYILGQLWALHTAGSSRGPVLWPEKWKQDQQDQCCPEKSKMLPQEECLGKWFFLSEMR